MRCRFGRFGSVRISPRRSAANDLGGEVLQSILKKLGAAAVTPACHLTIRHSDLDARAEELASFLEAEDYEDQFTLLAEGEEPQWALFSVTVEGP